MVQDAKSLTGNWSQTPGGWRTSVAGLHSPHCSALSLTRLGHSLCACFSSSMHRQCVFPVCSSILLIISPFQLPIAFHGPSELMILYSTARPFRICVFYLLLLL